MGETSADWSGPSGARRLWHVLEPVHAVTYFAPECDEAYRTLGLKGFWMGYFASRSAPMGPVPPAVVTATFFNFRPSMVERALPDAWGFASPGAVLDARLTASVAALQRLLARAVAGAGPVPADAEPSSRLADPLDRSDLTEAADLAEAAARACRPDGRSLFAALSSVPWPTETLARLWHAASLLREHRGDGHVIANVASGIDGLGSHLLQVAVGGVPRERLQPARGWTDEEWAAGVAALTERGLLTGDGSATEAGRAVRARVEDLTDELAVGPWAALGPAGTARVHQLVGPWARRIIAGGGVPAVSPIGDLTVNT